MGFFAVSITGKRVFVNAKTHLLRMGAFLRIDLLPCPYMVNAFPHTRKSIYYVRAVICASFFAAPITSKQVFENAKTHLLGIGSISQSRFTFLVLESNTKLRTRRFWTRNHRQWRNDQNQHLTRSNDTISRNRRKERNRQRPTWSGQSPPNLKFFTVGATSLLSPFGGL